MRRRDVLQKGRKGLSALMAVSMTLALMPTPALGYVPEWTVDAYASGENVYDNQPAEPITQIDTSTSGARAVAENLGVANAAVGGNVSAGAEGARAEAYSGGYAYTYVSGDVNAGKDGATAIANDTQKETVAQVQVIGGITADGEYGAKASANGGESFAIVAVGNVDEASPYDVANCSDVTSRLGVSIEASEGASASVYAKDITATGAGAGVSDSSPNVVKVSGGGEAGLFAGNVDSFDIGVKIINEGGLAASLLGGIESGGAGVNSTQSVPFSQTIIGVDGNINAGKALQEFATTSVAAAAAGASFVNMGRSAFGVTGSLTSLTGEGLSVKNDDQATFAALVLDKVVGATDGVSVAGTNLAGIDLTVWKIEAKSGKIIAGDDDSGTVANNVKYIVKIEQPEKGGTISATKADGTSLDSTRPAENIFPSAESSRLDKFLGNYDVAKEGEKVLLKVDLEEGYRIVGAYNGIDQEKVDLLMDDDGNYYVIVPRGGGIYLTAALSNEYEVKFVNYDNMKLQAGTVVYGETPKYTEATPTKPADDQYTYEFVGWTPTISPVTGDIVYTATYKAVPKESPTPEPTPAKKDTSKQASTKKASAKVATASVATTTKALAKTGDPYSGLAVSVLLSAGVALMAVGILRRRRS